MEIRTERLLLRRFRDSDRTPFAALNADPRVMRHFRGPLDRAASDDFVDRIEEAFATRGHSLWAVEVLGGDAFIGFVGLWVPGFDAPFTPTVEVGWRLAAHAWGNGYATEGANAALDDGFVRCGIEEVVSFTTAANRPSRAVMERLGMVHCPEEDFDHPSVPPGRRIRPHVLYRFPDPAARCRQAFARLGAAVDTDLTEAAPGSAPAG